MNRLTRYLPFLIGLCVGFYFITWGAIGPEMAHFPGDLADARFNNYILEHAYQFFCGQVDSYWNATFMYPEKNVISYSDNLLGTAPFYALIRLIGFNSNTSFQLWFILMSILNYTGAYFFLRFLLKNNYAAASGAMVFAFSLALQSQLAHAQTFPRFMVPMSMFMALMFSKELRAKYFFLMLLCVVYQIYCGIYIGFMLIVPIVTITVLTLFYKRGLFIMRLRNKRWVSYVIISFIISALLLLPLLLPYIERAKQMGYYKFEQVLPSLPTLRSYLFSLPGTFLWDFNSAIGLDLPAFWDHQIFAGGIATFCLTVCFCLGLGKILTPRLIKANIFNDLNFKTLFVTAVITFVFFIRVEKYSFYWLLYKLPGFGSMRALQRIINVELMFFALAVSFLLVKFYSGRKTVVFLLFLIFVALFTIDNCQRPDYVNKELISVAKERERALAAKIGVSNGDVILSYEPDTIINKSIFYHLDAMVVAQELKIKTLNGYSATSPDGYGGYWVNPNEDTRINWLNKKKAQKLKILVVH